MNNETLSAKQANNIIESENEILAACKAKMEQANDEFVDAISRVWEDTNAVEFMQTHKANFESFIEELSKNNRIFADTVKEIAMAYIKAGAMTVSVTAAPLALVGRFVVDKVKDTFADSENGDDFGFKNPDSAPAEVTNAINTLKGKLASAIEEATSKINSINAFGNQQVKLNLAKSAGELVRILSDHINETERTAKDYVAKTAAAYKGIGAGAAVSANLKSGN